MENKNTSHDLSIYIDRIQLLENLLKIKNIDINIEIMKNRKQLAEMYND
mgnify:CR=1 FL=1